MLNVSELLSDPDFAQPFQIQRSTGSFQLGGFAQTTTTLAAVGVILPASEREIQMAPEGDRVTGMISIRTATPLLLTHADGRAGLSDVILWRGESYRLLKLWPYQDFGLSYALGARVSGA